jgi:hypothetical protein
MTIATDCWRACSENRPICALQDHGRGWDLVALFWPEAVLRAAGTLFPLTLAEVPETADESVGADFPNPWIKAPTKAGGTMA